jgi:LEA14-like dessication related protein
LPIVDSMSGAISKLEGTYTKEATLWTGPASETVTIGYEVVEAWATWGRVNQSSTQVRFHLRLHNPSERVPIPAAPDGLAASIEMNDVSLVDVRGDAFGLESVDRDALIRPGGTREIVYVVVMDSDRVDDWFRRHVERGERSTVDV